MLEFEKNKDDNTEQQRFYSLPIDQHVSDIQFKSKTSESIAEINTKILDFITTSTIATTIIGALTTIFMTYVAYKIIIVILKACIKKDIQTFRTQEARIPIRTHEAYQEKFELKQIELYKN